MESTPVLAAPSVSPQSLVAAFATVPDPRRAASVVYPLAAVLALAVAAIWPTIAPSWRSPSGGRGRTG
jgi:hypothetical protein